MYYKRGLTYDQAFFLVEHRNSTDEDQQIIIHQSIQKLKLNCSTQQFWLREN